MQTRFHLFYMPLISKGLFFSGTATKGDLWEQNLYQGENRGSDAWNPRYYI
jgi:hypothetical protein